MIVLICGGRDFDNADLVRRTMDRLRADRRISYVVQGGSRGADALGQQWAFERGIPSMTFPADWNTHGKAAGPIRNAEMLARSRPDLVVAFPGGRGTADMVGKARNAGVEVLEVQ